MSASGDAVVEEAGWRFFVPAAADPDNPFRERLVKLALAAARGECPRCFRRSRYASSYLARIDSEGAEREIFIKLYDAPRGLRALKRRYRGPRARHVVRICRELSERGFGAPRILLWGAEKRHGREIIATARVEGRSLSWTLARRESSLLSRRAALYALGAEVARMHEVGFVHGDLTPYNVLMVLDEPPRFVFIDHDRTRRTMLSPRRRSRLRNLVQLGRFDIPRLTRTDRMRVLSGYLGQARPRARRRLMRRAVRMLKARRRRDSKRGPLTGSPAAHPAWRQREDG